ncbi:shikimate kinase [Methanobacterium sp. SMA-27]|uniref:shikimate kinase n=1 Tax=Methanobacterium sp. SMA-27 TaxID=1495336 RepID=UPI00064EF4B5|nr:shikimate kinase [Methanobacterium sp. SMA-27]
MKTIVKSPGSATIINAIATGYGSAFGIKRYVTAEVQLKGPDSSIICSADRDVDMSLMEICVKMVINKFKENYSDIEVDTGFSVKTSSTLPVSSGLSSSSATSNSIVMATAKALMKEYDIKSDKIAFNDLELLNIGVDASLEAGVTITGAFDDASASFYGGLTVTNNNTREILKMHDMEQQNILVYMPNRISPTAQSDVRRMKLIAPQVKLAFNEALHGNICNAMTLNGILYCASLAFDPNIALDALDAGATAAGLSGTGPAFVAMASNENVDKVKEAWSSLPGQIFCTEVDNEGTRVIDSG